MAQTIRLGISTCPNDTFAFHGLLTGAVDQHGLDIDVELLDIQRLNERLFAGDFDVAKASFHAALRLAETTVVLPTGAALGFGNGPLLLAALPHVVPESSRQLTLCPGQLTTATLLFQMFYPDLTTIEHVVFSEIMPRLKGQRADFGVCIHEGRFTWQEEGLALVEDLGERWESEMASPLPLGGILASRQMPIETTAKVQSVIRASLEYGLANRQETIPTMKRYAQELSIGVLMAHVDLYVNEWTLDLGDTGRRALQRLSEKAVMTKLLDGTSTTMEVFSG